MFAARDLVIACTVTLLILLIGISLVYVYLKRWVIGISTELMTCLDYYSICQLMCALKDRYNLTQSDIKKNLLYYK